MKRFLMLALIASAIILPKQVDAQVNIQVNFGNQPQWGPAGYKTANYYYLPDIDSYYDVNRSQFIYLNSGNWVFAKQLPVRYKNYNLYNGYKVVLNEPRPYLMHKSHKAKYVTYKNYKGKQKVNKYYGKQAKHYGKPAKHYGNSAKHYAPGQQKKRH